MISRKRVKDFNKILTCLLCKGYLIEATTINICMHSFCRSCIVKHIKLFESCPICDCEIRLGNLRPDIRLRSIVYKIIPGLYAKERQNVSHDGFEQRIFLNGTSSGAHALVSKYEKQTFDICYEDEKLAKQYFYDPEEPISLSLEYHMESIFGSNNITSISNNIPQVRYLQAPAAFKVLHLKKFLSSKYDLSNLKKPMCIDIIYEGDILSDEFSLMDIAYTYNWEREAPLKLFYRIYKSKKHNNNNEINLIKKALINQPFVKLSSADFRATMEESLSRKVSDAVDCNNHAQESSSTHHNNNNNSRRMNTNSTGSIQNQNQKQQSKPSEAPRHDLKIIIAKKPSSKNSKVFDVSNNKIKLNKPNSYISKVLINDCERLRGDVDNFTSSEIASTSEMKTTLSKKTGTVSHHDLKFENKSSSSGSMKSSSRHNNNTDSHDFYEYKISEGEKEKQQQQKRESTKHTNSSTSSSSSFSHHSTAGRNEEKFKVKSNLSLNIPKLKIELPSLKTKITVPKTPNESYSISKSPFSNNAKCEPQIKRVRFDMSNTPSYSSSKAVYDFDDEIESMNSCVDQKKYAARIGLKPVERKVDSIILHRKRKKSKHSKDPDHSSKRPKLHVSSSSYDDESLKLKLKIMGGKNCKNDKKFNNNEEAYEKTYNFKASHYHKTTDSSSINVQHEYSTKKQEQEKHKEAVIELENHKYSVTEQKIPKSSNSNQPMVFIPKLVLQKSTSVPNTFTASSPTSTSSDNSFNKSNSSNNNTNNSNINSKKEETTKVQRRNSIYSDQHKKQQEQSLSSLSSSSSSLPSDAEKSKDLKIKIKTLDKLSGHDSNSVNNQQKLMKPPTAKMGSPSSDIQAQITSTLASSPIRPNSIPASLKLSPISATAASPTISVKSEMQLQNLKRSLSLGAEKSPHCYINPYAKTNTEMFTRDPPLIEIPPLIPTSSTIRNFYNSNNNSNSFNHHNNQSVGKMSPISISKVPNINVKDPTKLFPNACPSVEILKIPQAAPIVNRHQQHQPSVKNIKLNRQMPPTIPLEKIKQTAQNPTLQKILPKSLQSTQNFLKSSGFHGKIDLPHRSTTTTNNNNNTSNKMNNLSFNTSDLCQNPISQDLTLERYHYELSSDIAKLDQSLSLEKNFEHWGKQKMQEYSKISDIKNFATSPTAKSLLNQQNMNLSVRNIPNPSALMMFRNQANNLHNSNKSKSPTSTSSSPKLPTVKETVSSSTSDQCSDIEEILSKSTISKSTEKPFSENYSQNLLQSKFSPSSLSSNHGKINDKKSIEKLTEYLRLTATAAKSKEMRQDDDNNNNNSSPKNDKNFNLIDTRKQKSSSSDVICIDS
ncbi:hypothetical protein ACKWTF_002912 [Chironomus riparius]